MTTKDWISIFSLIISGIAILISYHSNVKQSELQEKIKNWNFLEKKFGMIAKLK